MRDVKSLYERLSKVPTPDRETVAYVAMLRTKDGYSQEEAAFLEYFDLLEEIRSALAGDKGGPTRDGLRTRDC